MLGFAALSLTYGLPGRFAATEKLMTMTDNDEHKLIAQRRQKLDQMREQGNAFPNDFRRDSLAAELHAQYDDLEGEQFEDALVRVKIAGRMMGKRVMGKASFAHIQDMSGRLQLFVQRDTLPEGRYQNFKSWDIGDIICAEGVLFKTRTGELSVKVDELRTP